VAVNQARVDQGLAPYRRSQLLSEAAQRHADDVAVNGFTSADVHVGSDGTLEQERVAATNYGAWTWNGGGAIVDENMWSGHGTIEDALTWFLNSDVHRSNILSERYREIGIGVAADDAGRSFYVLVFGVRPNVLPIFINEDVSTTDEPQVAIRLTNENARPDGEGADKMGEAVEVRVNDGLAWEGVSWQPWARYVSWTLPEVPGEHTVYVQYRDAAGRTAEAADTIVLTPGEGTPLPSATSVPPTATPTLAPTETPVPPTEPPTATSAPTATPPPTATVSPSPVPLEPTPIPATSAPILVSPSPQAAAEVDVNLNPDREAVTPFPTWTPLPTPLPPQPRRSAAPIGTLIGLQAVALLLGLYLALRRGGA